MIPTPSETASIHSALLAVMEAEEQVASLLPTLKLTLDVCTLAAPALGDLGHEELMAGLAYVEKAKGTLERKLAQLEEADPECEAKLILKRICRP